MSGRLQGTVANTLYRIDSNPTEGVVLGQAGEKGVRMPRTKAKRSKSRVKTVDEVAALLGISRASAYEAARRKEIPTIRIGRRVLVPSDALEKLLACESA